MKILVLCGEDFSSNAIINALIEDYDDISVVIEKPISRRTLIKRRIKRLGIWKVIGQLLFMVTVPKILSIKSKDRLNEIIDNYRMDISDSYKNKVDYHKVDSVNNEETISIIKRKAPDIIVVNGTRIIKENVLNSIDCPIINMHSGITPKYRGVHGGYWAVANNDLEHCGVTIHKVAKGIDTGEVIKQALIPVTAKDNYVTYPYLQVGEGIKIEKEVLDEFYDKGIISTHNVELPSQLWYHPTIWEYCYKKK